MLCDLTAMLSLPKLPWTRSTIICMCSKKNLQPNKQTTYKTGWLYLLKIKKNLDCVKIHSSQGKNPLERGENPCAAAEKSSVKKLSHLVHNPGRSQHWDVLDLQHAKAFTWRVFLPAVEPCSVEELLHQLGVACQVEYGPFPT